MATNSADPGSQRDFSEISSTIQRKKKQVRHQKKSSVHLERINRMKMALVVRNQTTFTSGNLVQKQTESPQPKITKSPGSPARSPRKSPGRSPRRPPESSRYFENTSFDGFKNSARVEFGAEQVSSKVVEGTKIEDNLQELGMLSKDELQQRLNELKNEPHKELTFKIESKKELQKTQDNTQFQSPRDLLQNVNMAVEIQRADATGLNKNVSKQSFSKIQDILSSEEAPSPAKIDLETEFLTTTGGKKRR